MSALLTSLERIRRTYPPQQRWLGGHCWELIETAGGPQPLLLLPGGLAVAETAFRELDYFGPRYRVLAPTYPATATSVVALVGGLQELLLSCAQPAWVVGGSYSGLIAQALLAAAGPQIAQIVLSSTGVTRRWRGELARAGQHVLRWLPQSWLSYLIWNTTRPTLRRITREQRFWMDYFRQRSRSISRAECLSHLAVWSDFDRRWRPDVVPPWVGRMLIIVAGQDALFGPSQQLQLLNAYPQAIVRIFAASDHGASLELIDDYIALIDAFLTLPDPAAQEPQ